MPQTLASPHIPALNSEIWDDCPGNAVIAVKSTRMAGKRSAYRQLLSTLADCAFLWRLGNGKSG